MAFADNLPISESLGVFISIAGLDWLDDGHAEPMRALAIALVAGAVIVIARRWMKQRQRD